MPLILTIDTATEHAGVCLTKDDQLLAMEESFEQKNHANFVQPAIKRIMSQTGYDLKQVDAIAVTEGPGSYTGLRVGLASAKGLCFALNKPLLLVNTLEAIALAAIRDNNTSADEHTLFCPMIDARRMEVFTALYNRQLEEILPPSAAILDETSLGEQLQLHKIIFNGNGSLKFRKILNNPNAAFIEVKHNVFHVALLALKTFTGKHFAELAYSEPLYIKEFFTITGKG